MCVDLVQSSESKGAQLAVEGEEQGATYGFELVCVKGAQLVVVLDLHFTTYGLGLVCVKAGQLAVLGGPTGSLQSPSAS